MASISTVIRPSAVKHVTETIRRFYPKLWTLRYLKKNVMPADDILNIYKIVVRLAVEYCSVVYHSLITQYMVDKLEQCRLFSGQTAATVDLLDRGVIESLEARRVASCRRFAEKGLAKPAFQF